MGSHLTADVLSYACSRGGGSVPGDTPAKAFLQCQSGRRVSGEVSKTGKTESLLISLRLQP
jgi:hypothetical protein